MLENLKNARCTSTADFIKTKWIPTLTFADHIAVLSTHSKPDAVPKNQQAHQDKVQILKPNLDVQTKSTYVQRIMSRTD